MSYLYAWRCYPLRLLRVALREAKLAPKGMRRMRKVEIVAHLEILTREQSLVIFGKLNKW